MKRLKSFASIVALLAVQILAVSPAFAAKTDKIIIGVIPELNLVRQMERFVPLSEYLDKKIPYDVEIRPLSNYGQLFEELRDGNIDGGFFGSFVYGITKARIGIIPLVRPVSLNGKSTYTDVIFVRKDDDIRKPEGMRGKVIALADPATSAGYLAQKEYFAAHGINIDRDMKILWTGSHEAAIRAVLNHQADVGGAKDTVIAKFRKENRFFDSVIEIIRTDRKRHFPDNTLAVRKGLNQQKRDALKNALLKMHSDPEAKAALAKIGATKFIQTTDDDFKSLYEMTRHLKIDIANYPYKRPTN